jgi:hypothetical protein
MPKELVEVKRWKQLAFSFVGLLAGNAFILLYFLRNAIWTSFYLMRRHIGAPGQEISGFFQMFILYEICSLVGWILVGIPFSLLVPGRSIARLPWPFWILAGALLGPLAVFVMFLTLSHGHLDKSSFAHTGFYWIISVVIAGIAFAVYGAMLRWEIHALQREDGTLTLSREAGISTL